ncbi:glycosyltransferase [Vibrio breoganii]|uniref:glycosyltransferase n=1 Tax=Vibrio breoganii TaxID=553239 RepID=UPI000C83F80B|nr:glycosyltransferase [Vibrio breoganii]PMK42632.1 hypothetical protein BCU00_12495 [Vibrio breoganii]
MLEQLYVYCPGKSPGGTNALFSKVAEYWRTVSDKLPIIIDFKDGIMHESLKSKNVEFDLIEHIEGKVVYLPKNSVLLINLLSARLIGYKIIPHKNTKIVMWSTHPLDAFKWFPSYHLTLKKGASLQKRHVKFLHGKYYARLTSFYDTAIDKNGLIFMDDFCAKKYQYIFNSSKKYRIVPVFSDVNEKLLLSSPKNYEDYDSFIWVGRVADFKYKTLVAILNDLNFSCKKYNRKIKFNVIGGGAKFYDFKNKVNEIEGDLLDVNLLGTMGFDELSRYLSNSSDVFIGHGLSMIEAAKFGLPCIVADGTYLDFNENTMKYRWFSSLSYGSVGNIISKVSDMSGVTLDELLTNEMDMSVQGCKSYSKWKNEFSPENNMTNLYDVVSNCNFTYEDFLNKKVLKFNIFERFLMWTKRKITNY